MDPCLLRNFIEFCERGALLFGLLVGEYLKQSVAIWLRLMCIVEVAFFEEQFLQSGMFVTTSGPVDLAERACLGFADEHGGEALAKGPIKFGIVCNEQVC